MKIPHQPSRSVSSFHFIQADPANAAPVEQVAATVNLEDQTRKPAQTVSIFKLDEQRFLG
jgi:hypothetical protein